MKEIIQYIKVYFQTINKKVFFATSLIIGILIYLNYHYHIDQQISNRYSFWYSLIARWLIFLLAFSIPYVLYLTFQNDWLRNKKLFIVLLLTAPAIFSLKMAVNIPVHFTDDQPLNQYWNNVFYWPLRLVITSAILLLIWMMKDRDQPFYGCYIKGMNWKPYILMLLIMVPLIAAASTQPDFLAVYPKLKTITGSHELNGLTLWHKLLFELSYGSDFFSIELFFRGFLVLGFIKWAGQNAILPMACFYCMIHFGKPLGECISSYFGGLFLGIVVLSYPVNSRGIDGASGHCMVDGNWWIYRESLSHWIEIVVGM